MISRSVSERADDEREAGYWLARAAQTGSAEGMHAYGCFLAKARFGQTARDGRIAWEAGLHLIRTAARMGNWGACMTLQRILEDHPDLREPGDEAINPSPRRS